MKAHGLVKERSGGKEVAGCPLHNRKAVERRGVASRVSDLTEDLVCLLAKPPCFRHLRSSEVEYSESFQELCLESPVSTGSRPFQDALELGDALGISALEGQHLLDQLFADQELLVRLVSLDPEVSSKQVLGLAKRMPGNGLSGALEVAVSGAPGDSGQFPMLSKNSEIGIRFRPEMALNRCRRCTVELAAVV
jgi:hypothetical protein